MDTKAKTPSEVLKSFKQMNKEAREKKASKMGFNSSESYIRHLELQVIEASKPASKTKKAPKTTTSTKTEKTPVTEAKTETKTKTKKVTSDPTTWPTIHVVDNLDASGSMMGMKFTNALTGINSGIKDLRSDTARVHYTYTLVEFSDTILFKYTMRELSGVTSYMSKTRSSTALFDSIGETVNKLKKSVKPGDKVLVNIYTDGQENASKKYTAQDISSMIEEYSKKGWTFTFIGTQSDVEFAQRILKFHDSNTLVYDGSALGLEQSLTKTRSARVNYSQLVEKGKDVSTGFYKDIEPSK